MTTGFIFMLAAACSTTAPSLVGTWKFVSDITINCTDPNDNDSNVCTLSTAECGILTITWGRNVYIRYNSEWKLNHHRIRLVHDQRKSDYNNGRKCRNVYLYSHSDYTYIGYYDKRQRLYRYNNIFQTIGFNIP